MGIYVNKELCTVCKGREEPLCVENCPGDLIFINKEGKVEIRNQAECWDCMACIKSCPYGALETRLPYQIADYKATLKPLLKRDKIIWKLRDIRGNIEEYIIPRKINKGGV